MRSNASETVGNKEALCSMSGCNVKSVAEDLYRISVWSEEDRVYFILVINLEQFGYPLYFGT